ncbi:MAG: hypothetical protein JWM54_1993 [Acidobacteriaceae bacterium]|nr:hypothetical protein [Acidobacteriaceae bacterium]
MIIFNTSKLSREEVEARGLRFAPLLGNATMTIADSASWCRSSGLPRTSRADDHL